MRPRSILAGVALVSVSQMALAQKPAAVPPSGELIYKTYCIGCHTTEVHWREKRLANRLGESQVPGPSLGQQQWHRPQRG